MVARNAIWIGPLDSDSEDIVVSNARGGTRSLVVHVGAKHARHFGFPRHAADLDRSTGHWHVAVRDPFDIVLSHCCAYAPDPKTIQKILAGFDDMIARTNGRPNTTFYDVASLPGDPIRNDHENPNHPAKSDIELAKQFPMIQMLMDWMDDDRAAFYKRVLASIKTDAK